MLAEKLEQTGRIQFVGRLANYKYFNMDQAIDNALTMFNKTAPHSNVPRSTSSQSAHKEGPLKEQRQEGEVEGANAVARPPQQVDPEHSSAPHSSATSESQAKRLMDLEFQAYKTA